jgi:tetratricopeptide (TPR) repeat protein
MSPICIFLLGHGSAFGAIPSSSPTASPTTFQIIQQAQAEHEQEFTRGAAIFGVSGDDELSPLGIWSDDEFLSYNIGRGNAGPSESVLTNGNCVFQTKLPLLSHEECEWWIQTARDTIASERAAEAAAAAPSSQTREAVDKTKQSRFANDRTNAQLGEARLSSLPPAAIAQLRQLLQTKIYPILESRFGIQKISVYDGLILGSIAPAISQPVHRDAGFVTINIALSPREGFVGGGTYIEGLEDSGRGTPLVVDRGVALCHSSGACHAGVGISSGERYQMVLFCLARDEPQIARRCHAMGLECIHDGDLDGAAAAFEAGLTVAPLDHKLIMGRGQVCSMKGDDRGAFRCLDEASKVYPLDHAASIAMGKMHLASRRPRAALRRFDTMLANVADRDLRDDAWVPLKASAWDARVTAARSAMLCAEFEANRPGNDPRPWSKHHLPIAIDRLRTSIAAAPQDGRLHELLERAEELLQEAESR